MIHPAVLGQLIASSFSQLLAKIEALPSLFAAFGRGYCPVICPGHGFISCLFAAVFFISKFYEKAFLWWVFSQDSWPCSRSSLLSWFKQIPRWGEPYHLCWGQHKLWGKVKWRQMPPIFSSSCLQWYGTKPNQGRIYYKSYPHATHLIQVFYSW